VRAWDRGFVLAWNEFQPTATSLHDGTSETFLAFVR
jgi:hypothetical protein